MLTIIPSRRAAAERADSGALSTAPAGLHQDGGVRARTVWTREFLTLPELVERSLTAHPAPHPRLTGLAWTLFVSEVVTALEPEVRHLFGPGIDRPGAHQPIGAAIAQLRMAGVGAPDLIGLPGRRLTALAAALDAYERALAERGGWDDADAYREATHRIEAAEWPSVAVDHLTVEGLYDATPLQGALLLALARRSRRVRVGIPFVPDDEDGHAYAFPYIHLWEGVTDPGLDVDIVFDDRPVEASVCVVTAEDPDDEVRHLADWVSDHAATGCPLHEICVVVPRGDGRLPAIAREFARRGIVYYARSGVAIEETPFFAAALLPFRLLGGGFGRSDVMSWVASPLTAAFDPVILAEAIAQGPASRGTREEWNRALSAARGDSARALTAALGELDRLAREELPPDGFWRAYGRVLDMAGLGHSAGAAGLRNTWELVHDELETALRDAGRWEEPAIGWRGQRRHLQEALRGRRAPAGRPGRGVFVLSPPEARGLSFRHTAMIGVSRGALALPDASRMILGDAERSALNERLGSRLFRFASDDAREGAILLSERIRKTRGEVLISHPREDGQGVPVLPALELESLRAQSPPAVSPPTDPPAWRNAAPAVRIQALQKLERGRAAFFARDPRERRGDGDRFDGGFGVDRQAALSAEFDGGVFARWSASRFESWSQCPHQFFARYVLGARPPDQRPVEPEPTAVGRLAHAALRILYEEAGPLGPDSAAIPEAVERAGEGLPAIERGDAAVWRITSRRVSAVLRRYLEAAAPEGSFSPRAFELDFGSTGSIVPTLPVVTAAGTVGLQGRLDRLDHDPASGRLRVIDYKYAVMRQDHKEAVDAAACGIHRFQMYVYFMASSGWARVEGLPTPSGIEGTIHCIREPKVLGPLASPPLGHIELRLAAAIEAATTGRYDPSPRDEKQCTYCDYRRGCRIASVSGDSGPDIVGEEP